MSYMPIWVQVPPFTSLKWWKLVFESINACILSPHFFNIGPEKYTVATSSVLFPFYFLLLLALFLSRHASLYDSRVVASTVRGFLLSFVAGFVS